MIPRTSVGRSIVRERIALPEVVSFYDRHPADKYATHPRARPNTQLALLLLLAGGGPATSSLRAIRASERTIGYAQLRFLG
jgi:hypothetical protein